MFADFLSQAQVIHRVLVFFFLEEKMLIFDKNKQTGVVIPYQISTSLTIEYPFISATVNVLDNLISTRHYK